MKVAAGMIVIVLFGSIALWQMPIMPKGLLMAFEKEEILDLLSFLQTGGKTEN